MPIGHRDGGKEGGSDLFAPEAKLAPNQIPEKEALEIIQALLEDPGVIKIGQDLKFDWQIFARRGIEVFPYDDIMLMSYVLDAGKGGHGLDELADKWLGHQPIPYEQVTGTGKTQVTFDRVTIEKAGEYAAERADVTLRLWKALKARMAAEHVATVYETLERPLVPVLARMEGRGISIDRQVLSRLSGEFAQRQGGLEDEINKLAGAALNPGSPKQLGDVLFGQMGLPGGTKTKTGQWATGARALEELAEQGHELPRKILDWRQVSKLRSTYTDALPDYVNAETQARPHLAMRWPRRRPAACRRRSRTCRTSRSAPRRAARSAAPSSPSPAPSSSPPTTRRSNCGCSPRSATSRSCRRRSATASTSTP